jgi:hypothetical protein
MLCGFLAFAHRGDDAKGGRRRGAAFFLANLARKADKAAGVVLMWGLFREVLGRHVGGLWRRRFFGENRRRDEDRSERGE